MSQKTKKGADNMKRKQYIASKTRKVLLAKKHNGVKEVIWSLNSNERRDEVARLGFQMIPWLYEIKTRPLHRIHGRPKLLKDIHFAYKRGKKYIVRHLDAEQLSLLKQYDFRIRVFKYKIILNE